MQLTNRSKQVSNKEMTLAEKMYLPAITKGLGITLKHFFLKKATKPYPDVKTYLGPVFRGHHVLKRDEQGRERCTACGLCAVACPAEAISMVAAERTKGEEALYREEKYAAVYEINMLRCIFCGLCEEACPKQAIYLRHDRFVPVFSDRDEVIYGKDKLVEKSDDRYVRTNPNVQATPTEPSLSRSVS
ncbi:NuoI/complex I 23 kDa subunit family protein [Arsenicibacter rosenii]|uniref:NADH-quinone oxidoreductase subunit I n=1 Tax=Arsenicibacter rosenii TaxID=1750698 RepID=A0A1S2VG81_9BACT|nr:NADH-quinone oxidoreductase subunit I [Arsenicibacter rosenii]OIN56908.1 NADH-quinone oxidoreductase subunit I [Arsenicibacter rosenii]